MDDDDNDNNQEQDEDGEEESTTGTYSKKKHFGKLEKDLRGWVKWQVRYSPRHELLKPFSINIESTKFTLTHKKQFDELKSTTKLKCNLNNGYYPRFNELNSKITKKIWGGSLTLTNKISENYNMSSKFSHGINIWQGLKAKYGLQLQKKKDVSYGGSLSFSYKRFFNSIPYLPFLSFVGKYNETFRVGTNLKTAKRPKWDVEYNGHITTRDNHKAYFSHKITYDPNSRNASPLSQTLTLNAQDGDSVATVNTMIQLDKFAIKTKEIRFLIEYDKKYRFGVQKRNDNYEFLVERYKISQRLLKTLKFSVGNKGCLNSYEGKLNIWKSWLDYTLNLRWKPGGGNFYNDFSANLSLKWNI